VPVKDQFIRQGSRLCADIAAATRPVVDNKLLAEPDDEGGGRQWNFPCARIIQKRRMRLRS